MDGANELVAWSPAPEVYLVGRDGGRAVWRDLIDPSAYQTMRAISSSIHVTRRHDEDEVRQFLHTDFIDEQ
jgi:hypothetical protein